MSANPYAQNYRQIDLAAEVEQASPHRLVTMLFEGFLTHVAKAKIATQAGQFDVKARNVQFAMNILVGLKGGLDDSASPELSVRLFELYDYCERRLMDASARQDLAGFDEVDGLIRQIKEAWEAIAPAAPGVVASASRLQSAVA
ncbi:MAG: flagellar export chaperone FliS [Halothiobacillus sp. 24-54-40]|jgi:flagellar protein FliS|nr:MAG: flagellar export chaperone FliS [Halothiobacillus sp. 35-54-62]OYY52369.1 MAG: flagellar export chaperone FliS [Halothiobacillus sp. 28-55-5]OYZ86844.1 MAG: flagellar export chaperone FliS [Halothiobacillus sp. 24-54-40]OZA81017.1 MAG: flagellar export chaperone FliS [Halothiobacillus sp. 39-53-45]HQS02510.1 flagellar export chaperone FliS [Halothiobacillus sp.]